MASSVSAPARSSKQKAGRRGKGGAISPSTAWERLVQHTKPEAQLVAYPQKPAGIRAGDMGRRIECTELKPKGDVYTQEEMLKLFWQLRERMAFHLQKAVKEKKQCMFRFYDSNNLIREFSLLAAFRLVMSFTVTEDLIEFLISPFSGFQTETVEPVNGESQADQSENISDGDVTVISVHQAREWIGKGVATKIKMPEEVEIKNQGAKHAIPLQGKACIIIPVVQSYGASKGVKYDHCYGVAVCGLGCNAGGGEKRLAYFDPMTNNPLESSDPDGEEEHDNKMEYTDEEEEEEEESEDSDWDSDVIDDGRFPLRKAITNPGAKDHHLRINAIKTRIITSLKKNTMPELKQQHLRTVFVEIDGYTKYGSGIVLAHTICKMRATPDLLLLPVVTKPKESHVYRLPKQLALYNRKESDHRLGKATVIAWFRVLVFMEEEIESIARKEIDSQKHHPTVFFDDNCSFEDHPVADTISEGWIQHGLYTSAISAAMTTYMQAEQESAWGKLFLLAFGRHVDDA